MKINFITGNIEVEASDYAQTILKEFERQTFCKIYPTQDSKKGFTKSVDVVFPKEGVYCIYKFEKPIYVGYSQSSIHNRISRFLCAARGLETQDENHSGAYKYTRVYGESYDELSVKFCKFGVDSLPKGITIQQVEKEVIYALKPVFNKQIYRSLFVGPLSVSIDNE